MNPRIVFLGTPEMSAHVLKGLVQNGMNVVGVVTKEDTPKGRSRIQSPSPVALAAEALSLPVHKPHRLRLDYAPLVSWKPDLLLTFAYGQILSDEILSLGTYKPLNLHGSLLPKYRGASPIQAALWNGDTETGVSLMEMVHEMDAGDVYAVEKIPILQEDNYTSLCAKMADAALALALRALPSYFEGKLTGVPQDPSLVSKVGKITKEQEKLSLEESPLSFVNHVRALSLEPGAYLLSKDGPFKVLKAAPFSEETSLPAGTLFTPSKGKLALALEKGSVLLELVQKPGKKPVSGKDFLNGVKDLTSYRLF